LDNFSNKTYNQPTATDVSLNAAGVEFAERDKQIGVLLHVSWMGDSDILRREITFFLQRTNSEVPSFSTQLQ